LNAIFQIKLQTTIFLVLQFGVSSRSFYSPGSKIRQTKMTHITQNFHVGRSGYLLQGSRERGSKLGLVIPIRRTIKPTCCTHHQIGK